MLIKAPLLTFKTLLLPIKTRSMQSEVRSLTFKTLLLPIKTRSMQSEVRSLTFKTLLLHAGVLKMTSRSVNMKRINKLRSAEVTAMLDFLIALDNGSDGDFDGFNSFNIESSELLKGQINSYRAEKIAKLLGKTVSKKHLKILSKPVGYNYLMTSKEVDKFVNSNLQGFTNYWIYSKGVYLNNV